MKVYSVMRRFCGAAMLRKWKRVYSCGKLKKYRPPFSEAEADAKVDRAYENYKAGTGRDEVQQNSADPAEDDAPEIHADAFHELAGSIVELINPSTESDPKAILIHILKLLGEGRPLAEIYALAKPLVERIVNDKTLRAPLLRMPEVA